VSFEPAVLDFSTGYHKSAAYLQINPLGQVPLWVDGDVVVRDSQAILVYLAQHYADPAWLLPTITDCP